jgi:peptidoglycan/LPS O-acetylase OafA/YrhL
MPAAVPAKQRDFAVEAPNVAPPPGNPRFPLFDSLRAIAALTVLGAHSILQLNVQVAHPFLKWASPLAAQGVAIFFLISGFLLYRPSWSPTGAAGRSASATTRAGASCASCPATGLRSRSSCC